MRDKTSRTGTHDTTLEHACDLLEEEARSQAMKDSPTLLISLLKPYRPAKCAERHSGQVTGTPNYTVNGKTVEERMKEVAEVWRATQARLRGEPADAEANS